MAIRWKVAAGISGVIVLSGGVSASAHSAVEQPSDDQLLAAATEVTQQRADSRVEGQSVVSGVTRFAGSEVPASAEFVAREDAAKAGLRRFRDDLLSDGVAFTAAHVRLTTKGLEVAEGTAKLTVTEETSLDYKEHQGDAPGSTSGVTERVFTFSQQGGQWVLVDQRPVSAEGALAITDPPAEGEPARPTAEPAEPEVAAATARPAEAVEPKAVTTDAGSNFRAIAAGYNYRAMADYAERYAERPNTAYRDFGGDGNGGDCTNFISQALRAGGWQDKPGWYRDYHYWWYNGANQTWSWANANHWGSFAISSGRTRNLSNVWQLGLADILQVKGRGGTVKTHSTIVHKVVNGMPYLAYHTNNRKNVSLSEFLRAWPGGTFYAYRT